MGNRRALIAILAYLVASQAASSPVHLKCDGNRHAELYDDNKVVKTADFQVTEGVVFDAETDRFEWTAEILSRDAQPCSEDWWNDPRICVEVDETKAEYRFWLLYPLGFTIGNIDRAGVLSAQAEKFDDARTPEHSEIPPGPLREKDIWTLICAPGTLRVSDYYDCECGHPGRCPLDQGPPWCEVPRSTAMPPVKIPELTWQLKEIGLVALLGLALIVPAIRMALILLLGAALALWLAYTWLVPHWEDPLYVGLVSMAIAAVIIVAMNVARRAS
jgi:hypothetical protein